MAKKYYLPKDGEGKALWFENLAAKVDTYKTKYGLTVGEVNFIKALALYFRFWFNQVDQLKATIKSIVNFKDEILKGVEAGGTPSSTPADISFAAAPPSVTHGAIRTIASIVNRIKKHVAYTTVDGDDLKIEGAEPDEDIDALKPVFTIKMKNGHPEIVWKKGIATALKIMVARDIGNSTDPTPPPISGFQFLAVDTVPNYIDTEPLPSLGKSEVTGYRAKYMINDEEVGEWSDIVFATVTGE